MERLGRTTFEFYELGIEALADELSPDELTRFLRQCKPGTGDYTAERHKWLKNEPIDAIADSIEAARIARKEEERVRAQRIAAWRKNLLELTDIEIFEVGVEVLLDKIGHYGLLRFFGYCHQNYDELPELSIPDNEGPVVKPTQHVSQATTPTPWLQEAAGAAHPPASMADESERGIS